MSNYFKIVSQSSNVDLLYQIVDNLTSSYYLIHFSSSANYTAQSSIPDERPRLRYILGSSVHEVHLYTIEQLNHFRNVDKTFLFGKTHNFANTAKSISI